MKKPSIPQINTPRSPHEEAFPPSLDPEEQLRSIMLSLIDQTSDIAKSLHGKRYSTHHEGYAIMLEEYEEAVRELNQLTSAITMLWERIKHDAVEDETYVTIAKNINFIAACGAAELIHVGAVAKKLLDGVVHSPVPFPKEELKGRNSDELGHTHNQ